MRRALFLLTCGGFLATMALGASIGHAARHDALASDADLRPVTATHALDQGFEVAQSDASAAPDGATAPNDAGPDGAATDAPDEFEEKAAEEKAAKGKANKGKANKGKANKGKANKRKSNKGKSNKGKTAQKAASTNKVT